MIEIKIQLIVQHCWGFSLIILQLICKQSLGANQVICNFTYPQAGPAYIS